MKAYELEEGQLFIIGNVLNDTVYKCLGEQIDPETNAILEIKCRPILRYILISPNNYEWRLIPVYTYKKRTKLVEVPTYYDTTCNPYASVSLLNIKT